MEKLKEVILKISRMIEPNKNIDNDPIKHLEHIEYRLIYLIEARDYIINSDQSKAKEVFDCEKKLDLGRRNEKIEKIKKMEKEKI